MAGPPDCSKTGTRPSARFATTVRYRFASWSFCLTSGCKELIAQLTALLDILQLEQLIYLDHPLLSVEEEEEVAGQVVRCVEIQEGEHEGCPLELR